MWNEGRGNAAVGRPAERSVADRPCRDSNTRRDARSSTGREWLVDRVASCLDSAPAVVAVLHGEVGMGKARVADRVIERLSAAGWDIRRSQRLTSDDLQWAHASAADTVDSIPRLLVLSVADERAAGMPARLELLLESSSLTAAVLLIARRIPPAVDPGAPVFLVDRLADFDACELTARLGVAPATERPLITWAGGLPLLLELGAQHLRSTPDWSCVSGHDPAPITERLVTRLFPRRIAELLPALLLAALTRELDQTTLKVVLGAEFAADYERLAALAVIDELPGGLRMHVLARRALIAYVGELHPQLERGLRSRLADHLLGRETVHGSGVSADLSLVSRSAVLARLHRADQTAVTRPALRGDGPLIRSALRRTGVLSADRQALVDHYLERAPAAVTIADSRGGRPLAYAIALSARASAALDVDDPALGWWLRRVERASRLADAVLVRDSVDLSTAGAAGEPTDAQAAAHVAALINCATDCPRHLYVMTEPGSPMLDEARRLLKGALSAESVESGRGSLGSGGALICHHLDLGPGGLLGAQRRLIQAETGIGVGADPGRRASLEAAVRDFQRPDALSANPLAVGIRAEDRINQLRQMVLDAVAHGFGESYNERALREVILSAYIRPRGGHEQAARALNMSRAAYFRKLRIAVDRVVTRLDSPGVSDQSHLALVPLRGVGADG